MGYCARFSVWCWVVMLCVVAAPLFSAPADGTDRRWSYAYGESRVSLLEDATRCAVKIDANLEDGQGFLANILSKVGGFARLDERDGQEYPGLWFPRFRKGTPADLRLAIIERLHLAPGVEFAAPVLIYGEAIAIPMPEIILTFDADAQEEEIREILAQDDLRLIREFSALDPTFHLSFFGSPVECFARCDELNELEAVFVAEPNLIWDLPEMATPNDPLFSDQWDLSNTGQTGGTAGADMNALAAWDISTGSASIVIAICDEGVDVDHPDLIGNIVAGHDSVTADSNPPSTPGDAGGNDAHGTCCAGIASASGNNGIGVSGVNWNAKIMPVRLGFGNYWTATSWIIDAITWATDNGADVQSHSWGGGGASTSIENAFTYAATSGRGGLGIACFCASGNENSAVSYPAKYAGTIAVGATSPCDERKSPSSCDGETWWGSNYGPELDIVAPGPLVTTTDIAGSAGYTSSDYIPNFNGTSSATPHAAGAGGLLLSVAPGLTAAQVREYMRTTSDDQVGPGSEDTPGFDNYMGYGRVNLESLLLAVGSTIGAPTNLSCSESGGDVTLSWTNGDSYTSISVSRDSSVIATLAGSSTSYVDAGPSAGSHSYAVRGHSGSSNSPSASCSVFITGGATDIVWAASGAAGTVDGSQALVDALTANGRNPLLITSLDAVPSLDTFETVWVALGIYPSNHVLTSSEGSTLDTYVSNGTGGSFLYMEGGDTWAYDVATAVHARFGINGLSDGTGDLSTVAGVAGSGCDLSGGSWSYSGENSWIDHLGATGGSVVSLSSTSPSYDVGIFNDASSYRTFGTSFEIGGLTNGTSTQADLVGAIVECFSGVAPPPPPAIPTADFSATPTSGNTPLAVAFDDLSSGTIDSYSWNFGDGGSSTSQSPSHTYIAAGSYNVTLTVSNVSGSDTATCSGCITVTDPPPGVPTADFTATPTSGNHPLAVAFNDASNGTVDSYAWDFGDGGSSAAQNPFHTYTAAGSYTVTLTVSNVSGSDTATCGACITVSDPPPPAPTADFTATPTSGETPLTVAFTDASSGIVDSYAWDFGDGGSSSAQSPPHTYTAAGSYDVSLTVSNTGGSDTNTCVGCIVVTDPPPPPPEVPTANFSATPTSGDTPLAVDFTDDSTGTIDDYAWTFGDGGTSSAQTPSHIYTLAGSYTVTLTVSNVSGSDTMTCSGCIAVSDPPPPIPFADFTATPISGDTPLAVVFTDASSGIVDSYAWDFGDGGSSSSQNTSHTYTMAGSYTVTLTVSNISGSDTAICGACITVSDPLPPAPIANFMANPMFGEAPLVVDFFDASSGTVDSYAWDFGDGDSSSAQNPSHTYTAAGNYTVSLTVFNAGGNDTATCSACITVTDPLPPPPIADFFAVPVAGEVPLEVFFFDASTGIIDNHAWDFGDGGTSTASTPTHTYTAAGTYDVVLTVSNAGGSDTAICFACVMVTDPPPPPSGPLLYLSFKNNTSVPGVGTVRDEDIVSYDYFTDEWALFIDGSDIGLGGTDIDAFSVRADGSVVISFNSGSFSVQGLTGGPNGTTVDDSDLILFTPTSTGTNTNGSLAFLFDGSDISLTKNGEDIDGICWLDDGTILFSTQGTARGDGPVARDEDIVLFTPTSLGSTTSGSWEMVFDGSDVGYGDSSNDDIDGFSLDFDGTMLVTTIGSALVLGTTANDEDILRFTGTYGTTTSGTSSLEFDLSTLGISTSEDVDGVSIR